MNHNDEKRKVARSWRATSELTTSGQPVSFSTYKYSPNIYDCQMRDDVFTLEDALDLACDDTEAWITNQVQGGYMTPRTARDLYNHCPAWLEEFAVERYSMAEAGY